MNKIHKSINLDYILSKDYVKTENLIVSFIFTLPWYMKFPWSYMWTSAEHAYYLEYFDRDIEEYIKSQTRLFYAYQTYDKIGTAECDNNLLLQLKEYYQPRKVNLIQLNTTTENKLKIKVRKEKLIQLNENQH